MPPLSEFYLHKFGIYNFTTLWLSVTLPCVDFMDFTMGCRRVLLSRD